MDELTKRFLEHYQDTHVGDVIRYFDASQGIHISEMNSLENPTLPPKTIYKDLPTKGTKMPNDRDTHFLGFADLLLQDILLDVPLSAQDRLLRQAIQTLIAERAYDLVGHAFGSFRGELNEVYDALDALRDTPDLTQWPESPIPEPS